MIIKNIEDSPVEHKAQHPGYEYKKRKIIGRGDAKQCVISVYEIPPGKAAYPYHYHSSNEEIFFIIKGAGRLISPQGERAVGEGDFLFSPAGESGAHKLINSSESQALVYIDFDTKNDVDIAVYPDSGKVGIWGGGVNRIYMIENDVDYYEGE
jgi:uncharacterized cupin superfamily protein